MTTLYQILWPGKHLWSGESRAVW